MFKTAEGDVYNAIWAQGMVPCQGTTDDPINIGDSIEVYGEVTDAASVTICSSPDYYIVR